MKIEVRVPTVGESIVSGTITRWLVKNGDIVREDAPLFEMETDKVNVEVPSPSSGKIEILIPEGEEVAIGQTAAWIDDEFKTEAKETREKIPEKIKTEIQEKPKTVPSGDKKNEETFLKTSPSVRRLAGENDVDLQNIQGSGKDGRITKDDVVKKLVVPQNEERQTVVKMSPIRRTIAKRLLQARHEAAHVTTFNEINMEHVNHIRMKYKDDFQSKYRIKLGFMSFFVKACCQALKEFPDVNSSVREDEMIYHHFCDIGVAVAVDEGLIVPVIRDADRLSFAQIELKIHELAEKARTKKITIDELQGGTFSITNGGIFGSMMSTPIPNYPQTAILGMHAIKDRPYVVDGKIEIRPVMYAALTYDHRVIDGKAAVEFLVEIKKFIEDPESLLIEL